MAAKFGVEAVPLAGDAGPDSTSSASAHSSKLGAFDRAGEDLESGDAEIGFGIDGKDGGTGDFLGGLIRAELFGDAVVPLGCEGGW